MVTPTSQRHQRRVGVAIPTSPVAPNTSGSGRFDLASRLPTPRRNPIARAIQLSIPRRDPIARAITLSTLARESITRPITLSTLANESIISYRNYQFRTFLNRVPGPPFSIILSIIGFHYRFSALIIGFPIIIINFRCPNAPSNLSIFCINYRYSVKIINFPQNDYRLSVGSMEVVKNNYRRCSGSMKVVAVNYRFRSESMEIGTDRTHLPLLELYGLFR